jgi:hypothetical protein
MPLLNGNSRPVIASNIHEMLAAGHPPQVAIAAAIHNSMKKKPRKGSPEASIRKVLKGQF